ncbi:MAG: hypothetical protein R3E03_05685 [Novosphingobium sp.]
MIDAHFHPADLLVSDHRPTVPSVFVSDMDLTMIGQECIDELADFAGIKDHRRDHRTMVGRPGLLPEALDRTVRLLAGWARTRDCAMPGRAPVMMPGAVARSRR